MLAHGQRMMILLVGLMAFAPHAWAANDLADRARAAKATFRPLDESDLSAARAELDRAVAALDARLARAGDTAQGWRDYLHWPTLSAELAKADGPDLAFLEHTFARLSAGHEGLGLIWFSDLADATRRYVSVAKGLESSNVQNDFEKVVEALATSLETQAESPSGQNAARISAYLRWLSDARQTPELIDAVVSASNANLHASASAGLIDAAMGRVVDDTAPVRDVILGTRIYGTGRTMGNVSMQLVPCDDQAKILAVLEGTNHATTTGYNGPAIVHANGTTSLTTTKQIVVDAGQVSTLPAQADAKTTSHIRSIRAKNGMRLIEKLAWKRAMRQKCQADAIASRHAEARARARFDNEIDSLIGPSNEDMERKIREPLTERGLFPKSVRYSSTDKLLNLSVLQAGDLDFGATTEAPAVPEAADLSVRIHESMINNFTSAALAGMILRQERVQEATGRVLDEIPDELQLQADEEPWRIAFQHARPIWVAFGENEFTISIRGRSFYEGETQHPGMDVTATYRIEGKGDALKAVRQGDVQIFPPGFDPKGEKQLTPQQTVIRRILQRRLGKLFEEEIIPKGLVLPKKWRQAGKLKLVQWTAREGWLVLSWQRTGEPAPDDVAEVESELASAR